MGCMCTMRTQRADAAVASPVVRSGIRREVLVFSKRTTNWAYIRERREESVEKRAGTQGNDIEPAGQRACGYQVQQASMHTRTVGRGGQENAEEKQNRYLQ